MKTHKFNVGDEIAIMCDTNSYIKAKILYQDGFIKEDPMYRIVGKGIEGYISIRTQEDSLALIKKHIPIKDRLYRFFRRLGAK